MTTRQLADELTRVIDAAREGTLRPTELAGSTFTVSNRCARAGRGRAGDQPPGGGHPGHRIVAAASGGGRRCTGGALDDEADVRSTTGWPMGAGRRIPRRSCAIWIETPESACWIYSADGPVVGCRSLRVCAADGVQHPSAGPGRARPVPVRCRPSDRAAAPACATLITQCHHEGVHVDERVPGSTRRRRGQG